MLQNDIKTPLFLGGEGEVGIVLEGLYKRLFNYVDDNALINHLLAPLEVGHEVTVDTASKAHTFVNLSVNEYGRESFDLWGG